MTRSTLVAANRTEVSKAAVHRVSFIELKFPSGTVRSSTADRAYTWGGFTWLADARFIGASGLAEAPDLNARRASIVLSGVDSVLIGKVMVDKLHYSEVNLYEGFCDENWALVADPHPIAQNLLMSKPTIRYDNGTGEIEISAEQWTLFSARDSAVLATPQIQRLRSTGDTGMDKAVLIMTQNIQWGGVFNLAGSRTTIVGGNVEGQVEK